MRQTVAKMGRKPASPQERPGQMDSRRTYGNETENRQNSRPSKRVSVKTASVKTGMGPLTRLEGD